VVAWGTERTCRWIARNGEGSNSGEGHADAAWLAHDQSSTQRGRWSTGCANASAGRHFLGEDNDASEFGWKAVTDSPLTGVTRNPWDARLTSGGSSGGAGVAAALGMGTLHLGTDGGGSIRVPASFCGVIGFKPTFGVVSVHPHSAALTLWHQGPLTRTVSDAALMLTVMAGPDIRDWYAGPELSMDSIGTGSAMVSKAPGLTFSSTARNHRRLLAEGGQSKLRFLGARSGCQYDGSTARHRSFPRQSGAR
jgi:hypothetical protein